MSQAAVLLAEMDQSVAGAFDGRAAFLSVMTTVSLFQR